MTGLRCLAMETGGSSPSVAACNGERQCELWLPGDRKVAAALFETIDRALAEVELALEDLDCVAFGRGPGAFTGLRIAAAAAQGLGAGLGVELCSISSLAAMAQDALERMPAARTNDRETRAAGEDALPAGTWIAPGLPAGRAEVYIGWYKSDSSGLVSPGAEDWLAAEATCRLPGTEKFMAAGSIWTEREGMQAESAARIDRLEDRALPRAGAVLRLAQRDYAEGRLVAPEQAQPAYLRKAV